MPNENSTIRNLRTFKTDLAEAMKEDDASLARIYSKQKNGQPIFSNKPESNKKLLALVLFSILAAGAIAVAVFFFFGSAGGQQPSNPSANLPQPLLPVQNEIKLQAANKEDFYNKTNTLFKNNYPLGNLTYLAMTESAGELLSLIRAQPPSFFPSTLQGNIFLGILTLDKNYPVLIFEIKENRYDEALVGMLKWEKLLTDDLGFILQERTDIETPSFSDKIIKNQNTRVLQTTNGTIFLYSLYNKRYIIITTGQKSFEEIIKQFVLFKLS